MPTKPLSQKPPPEPGVLQAVEIDVDSCEPRRTLLDIQLPLLLLPQVDDCADPGIVEALPPVPGEQIDIFTAEKDPAWSEGPIITL